MTQPLCGFWTPPGPIDEILDISALKAVQERVEIARRMLRGGTSEASKKAVEDCDKLVAMLNSEVKCRIHELVKKIRASKAA
jgi:hypothetical protein